MKTPNKTSLIFGNYYIKIIYGLFFPLDLIFLLTSIKKELKNSFLCPLIFSPKENDDKITKKRTLKSKFTFPNFFP